MWFGCYNPNHMPLDVNEWTGKIEGIDYVVCRHCGHKAATLAMHLKFSHQTNAKLYLRQFPGTPIQSERYQENRRAAIVQAHKDNPTKGTTKMVPCGECGVEHEVSRFDQVSAICFRCARTKEEKRQANENFYWSSKTLGEEYVSCVGCGYRAVSLTSHIQNTHPEWVGCYPGQVTALFCASRNKPQHGRQKSVRQKMSQSAKHWDIRYTDNNFTSISGAPRGAKAILLKGDNCYITS
jgi:hypothetical protein